MVQQNSTTGAAGVSAIKNTDDLSDNLGGGLRNVVRRLKAVQQAGKNYQTFSGLHNGDTGSVKFIVETAEIKK